MWKLFDNLFNVLLILFGMIFFGFLGYIAVCLPFVIFDAMTTNEKCQRYALVKEVKPIGHKVTTSYYVTFEDNTAQTYAEPQDKDYLGKKLPVVGDEYCAEVIKVKK